MARSAAISTVFLLIVYTSSCVCLRETAPTLIATESATSPAIGNSISQNARRIYRRTGMPPDDAASDTFVGIVPPRKIGRIEPHLIDVPFDTFAPIASMGYWERRLTRESSIAIDSMASRRFKASFEEAAAAQSLAGEVFAGHLPPGQFIIPAPGATWGRLYEIKQNLTHTGKPSLSLHFLGEIDPSQAMKPGNSPPVHFKPPRGYCQRNAIDYELENAGKPSIHHIAGLEKFSPEERIAAKATILAYVKAGARNSHVNAIVHQSKTQQVLMGLQLQSDGTNDAIDIAVEGPFASPRDIRRTADLNDLARYYADRLPITTSGAEPENLAAWWNRRHPAAPLPAAAADENASRQWIAHQLAALSPAWFSGNYGINIADPSATQTRLRSQGFSGVDIEHLCKLEPPDLLVLELCLQRIDIELHPLLRGIWISGRDDRIASKQAHGVHESGKTFTYGDGQSIPDQTVVINASSFETQEATFAGDSSAVFNIAICTFFHELGHAIGNQNAIQDTFNTKFLATPVSQITWYAASEPQSELFPEVFACHFGRSAWFAENHPEVRQWMIGLAHLAAAPAQREPSKVEGSLRPVSQSIAN